MTIADELKKSITGNPAFTVVTGATDRAVASLRDVPGRVSTEVSKVGKVPGAVQAQAKELSGRAQTAAAGVAALAAGVYEDVSGRGKTVVGRVRSAGFGPGGSAAEPAKPTATTVRRTRTRKATS